MAITVDWPNSIINVPKSDTVLVQSSPYERRSLDTNWLRLELRKLEDDEEGRPWPRTHDHNADVTVGGITLADVLIILDPYTITFEDGQWGVILEGTNNNILDKRNPNQVSVSSSNSAGLIVSGSGVTQQDKQDIAALSATSVWTYTTRALTTFGTLVADIWSYVTRVLTSGTKDTEIDAIKERTDRLPDNPADVSDVPTAEENALELLDNQNAP
jgi:hypothetical protein